MSNRPLLAGAVILLVGCGDPTGPKTVSGTAHIVRGPKVALQSGATPSRAAFSLTSGVWAISPNGVKATITGITFVDESNNSKNATLTTTCPLAFTAGGQSLTQLLDCPFTVDAGTYVGIRVAVSNVYQVLIDDPVNNIYTDPASSSGLSTTRPAAGANYVSLTIPIPAGNNGAIESTTIFAAPLAVDSTHQPSITLVADIIHTVALDVANGVPTFHANLGEIMPAVELVGSVDGFGKVEYYNTYGTAQNVAMGNLTQVDNRRVRLFYASNGQPSYVYSAVGPSPSTAFNTSPADHTDSPLGWRPGGYLGLDSSGNLCWALPNDLAYGSYLYLLKMQVPSAIGGTTTLAIQNTTTVPAPTSGSTYASGCPAVTANETWNLTLVAR